MAGRHGQRRKDIKGVILTENDDVLRCGGFQTAFEYVGLEDKAYI